MYCCFGVGVLGLGGGFEGWILGIWTSIYIRCDLLICLEQDLKDVLIDRITCCATSLETCGSYRMSNVYSI